MFLAIIFIILGLFLLLNALGIIVGNFWGFFWAVFFLAIGFRMMMKKGRCPMCEGMWWKEEMHDKIHEKMHDHCGCGHDHEMNTEEEEEEI